MDSRCTALSKVLTHTGEASGGVPVRLPLTFRAIMTDIIIDDSYLYFTRITRLLLGRCCGYGLAKLAHTSG